MSRPSSRCSSQAAPNSGVQYQAGQRSALSLQPGTHDGGEACPRGISSEAGEGQHGTRCPLPRPHRVQEQSHAVAKHPDKPAAGAWTRSGTPQRAAPAPSGAGTAPHLGGPATPDQGTPPGVPTEPGATGRASSVPVPGRRPSPRTLHSCCP